MENNLGGRGDLGVSVGKDPPYLKKLCYLHVPVLLFLKQVAHYVILRKTYIHFMFLSSFHQTLANVYLALENNLEIIPILNKIDLPAADPDRVTEEIKDTIGLDCSNIG